MDKKNKKLSSWWHGLFCHHRYKLNSIHFKHHHGVELKCEKCGKFKFVQE